MGLPKITHPIFTTKLPSSGEIVRYRPFLVKEEKILLLALSGRDSDEMSLAAKQIVNNCVIDLKHDIETLPVFDIEWLFIQIRIKSVGPDCTLVLTGLQNESCDKCQLGIKSTVDLNLVECKKEESHNPKIELTEKIGIKMKYPTVQSFNRDSANVADFLYDYIIDCIECVYDDEKIYEKHDFKKEELYDFLDNLNRDQLDKIQNFFATMPECKLDVVFKCECGNSETKTIRGLSSFFE
jgi:hypothetical protein